MARSRYKITGSKINGQPQYPKTIVEAITWESKKKPLKDILKDNQSKLDNMPAEPFIISAYPVGGGSDTPETVESLAEKGITSEKVREAAKGFISAIVFPDNEYYKYFPIIDVGYVNETEWQIEACVSSLIMETHYGFRIVRQLDSITCDTIGLPD